MPTAPTPAQEAIMPATDPNLDLTFGLALLNVGTTYIHVIPRRNGVTVRASGANPEATFALIEQELFAQFVQRGKGKISRGPGFIGMTFKPAKHMPEAPLILRLGVMGVLYNQCTPLGIEVDLPLSPEARQDLWDKTTGQVQARTEATLDRIGQFN